MSDTVWGVQSGHVVIQRLHSNLSRLIATQKIVLSGNCRRACHCQLLSQCSFNIVSLALINARSQICAPSSQCLLGQGFRRPCLLSKESFVRNRCNSNSGPSPAYKCSMGSHVQQLLLAVCSRTMGQIEPPRKAQCPTCIELWTA